MKNWMYSNNVAVELRSFTEYRLLNEGTSVTPPVAPSYLLLEDGVSYLLQEDGVSKFMLE